MVDTDYAPGRWLAPLVGCLAELEAADWRALDAFDTDLTDAARSQTARTHASATDAARPGGPRSRDLLAARAAMARAGHLGRAVPADAGGTGRPAVLSALQQFVAGYHDLDLRDSSGLGHGRLIARHGCPQLRGRWLPRLLAGELAGIAVTEAHGGSRVRHTTTQATRDRSGGWRLTGTKTWISRLTEAAVFIVFFRFPDGRLAAAAVDADRPGLMRRPLRPAGLAGWSWGVLDLHDTPIGQTDLLGQGESDADAWPMFVDHFAYFRPLVAATALGAAAAVLDTVAAALTTRRTTVGARISDNALITLGRGYGQLTAALLAAVAAVRLADAGHPESPTWSCAVKAHGVDVAHHVVTTTAPLMGASSFRADSHLDKTRRDLGGLLFADGVHDSLYRAAGAHLLRPHHAAQPGLFAPVREEHIDA